MVRSLAPTLAKTLGLSALAGLASEGASQVVEKISGKRQIGGNLIPPTNLAELIADKHLLTNRQKQDIVNSYESGRDVVVKPTKTQSEGLLGTLLATIGVPLTLEVIKGITEKQRQEWADQKEKERQECEFTVCRLPFSSVAGW